MWGSKRRLTLFLLDLTVDDRLSEAFARKEERSGIIRKYRLDKYSDLLMSDQPDVQRLRDAVRAELGGTPRSQPVPGVKDAIIEGVRIPPQVREPPEAGAIEGVKEPPPDEPIPGVKEPPPDEPIPGVKEPPPEEPIPGVREPGPPESA